MMDFSKFKPKKDKCYYLYRCNRCGVETEFTIRLPEHLLTDSELRAQANGSVKRCNGKYEFVRETKASATNHVPHCTCEDCLNPRGVQ